MFVVLHHTWLAVWPAFPRNIGPWFVGWALYGHLAVAVFIVVSGFSLALAPMRNGGTLTGGTRRFLRRRAWRIIPPYWAALVISTIITALILQPDVGSGAVAKGFVVHGLLLQDIVGSFAPNGAFWSIAVEWQIYFVFPLILLVGRRTNFTVAVFGTVALVIVAEIVASFGSPLNKIHHVSPQFLALFALGVLAVRLGEGDRGLRLRRPLTALGLASIAVFAVLALVEGSVWIVNRYFWIDLLFGLGVASLMAVMFTGGLPRVRRVFASRVAVTIGLFSYSIYLLHGPLVGLFYEKIFYPMHLAPLVTFALLLVVGIPTILIVCYGFHLIFEAPFLRCRGVGALRLMPIIGSLLPAPREQAVHAPAPRTAPVSAAPDVGVASKAT
jgi:peptidoglycan/LPS O-acetylase OafA/YrhL